MRVRLSNLQKLTCPLAERRSLHVGQILTGSKAQYHLTEVVHRIDRVPTIFKARTVRHMPEPLPSGVIIKTVAPGNELSRDGLIRELNAYKLKAIASSRHIREMYDIIGDPLQLNDPGRASYPSLVFESLDTTLQDVQPENYRHRLVFLHTIIRAVLRSSLAFQTEGFVNADIKPDNIFISGLDTERPVVKIGDLGSVHEDDEAFECQPFAMRAPEVWRGLACTHKAEIWALGALILVWMKPEILGSPGINGYITIPIWSIAKLMQLFPTWSPVPKRNDFRREEFDFAKMLTAEPDLEMPGERRVKVSSLGEEMDGLQLPTSLQRMLRILLNPDPNLRPSASEALASKEYRALYKSALPSFRLDR